MTTKPQYTDEEAREILERAIERGRTDDTAFSHADLVEAAREVGIDPALVDEAAAGLHVELQRKQLLAQIRAHRREKFGRSLATYVIVNAFLVAIDLATGGGLWFYWPLLVWGLFIALTAVRTYLPTRAQEERQLAREERRLHKRRRRQEAAARARERAAARRSAEREFDQAVEQGVTLLLAAAARHLAGVATHAAERSRPRPRAEDSEFARYVDEHKHGTRGSRAASRTPAARAPVAPVAPPIVPPPAAPPPRVRVPDLASDGDASEREREEQEAEATRGLARKRRARE